MWSYTLLFPTILRSLPEAYQETAQSILLFGPFGINALRPESLLALNHLLHLHTALFGHSV